ncbi:MAG: hypothetical protein R2877_01420 [Bdellovibrionota bacterium]
MHKTKIILLGLLLFIIAAFSWTRYSQPVVVSSEPATQSSTTREYSKQHRFNVCDSDLKGKTPEELWANTMKIADLLSTKGGIETIDSLRHAQNSNSYVYEPNSKTHYSGGFDRLKEYLLTFSILKPKLSATSIKQRVGKEIELLDDLNAFVGFLSLYQCPDNSWVWTFTQGMCIFTNRDNPTPLKKTPPLTANSRFQNTLTSVIKNSWRLPLPMEPKIPKYYSYCRMKKRIR